MQQLMSQPQHEREKEVLLLRRSVAEKEQARAASDILCRSLADETHQLRRTLAATAHMCQHLAKCLDERQHAQGDMGEKSADEVGSKLKQVEDSGVARVVVCHSLVLCNRQDQGCHRTHSVLRAYLERTNGRRGRKLEGPVSPASSIVCS